MLKTAIPIFKHFIVEVLIIFSLVFLINNYIGNVDKTINADAVGYYEYLPSIFIHHDILRKNNPKQENSSIYTRINATNVYVDYNNFSVNKYPCGVALLQLPFFTYTYITSKLEGDSNDGYQRPFQKSVYYAAIFYLFLTLLFLKKTLVLYAIKKHVIIACQLLLVLSTSVTHYVNYDAGFSHVYSLFAITAFIYFIKSYLQNKNVHHFVLSCLFLGLIFILRQPNILILLFVPFLAGSIEKLKIGFTTILANSKGLLTGIFLFVGVSFIQATLWYMQTGNFLVYSYQGEGFNFSDPQFFNILFSYKKGLFVYTPVLFITLCSLFWLVYKKHYYLFFTWLTFFLVLTYVLCSWWSWFYGCSYGLRAYIDYYVLFFIPFALMLDKIQIAPKLFIILLALSTIPLNIIQTYQYKEYIIHWIDMNKEIYWKIFLKTDDRFKGLVWKSGYNSKNYSTVHEVNIGDLNPEKDTAYVIRTITSLDVPHFEKVNTIQVLIDNDYQEKNNSKIVLSINRSSDNYNYYYNDRYLIHFHEKGFNEWQTGVYNFEFNPLIENSEKTISFEIISRNQSSKLLNIRLRFLTKKETF